MKGELLPKFRPILSGSLRTGAALLAALASYLVIGVIAERWLSPPGLDAKASLLAVGDTGKVHRPLASLLEGQVAVGDGLAAEDRIHPVDAMLLLRDNFYMLGLLKSERVSRIEMKSPITTVASSNSRDRVRPNSRSI